MPHVNRSRIFFQGWWGTWWASYAEYNHFLFFLFYFLINTTFTKYLFIYIKTEFVFLKLSDKKNNRIRKIYLFIDILNLLFVCLTLIPSRVRHIQIDFLHLFNNAPQPSIPHVEKYLSVHFEVYVNLCVCRHTEVNLIWVVFIIISNKLKFTNNFVTSSYLTVQNTIHFKIQIWILLKRGGNLCRNNNLLMWFHEKNVRDLFGP